ncbi:hypothetical protein ACLH0O_08395 [Aeromonas media]
MEDSIVTLVSFDAILILRKLNLDKTTEYGERLRKCLIKVRTITKRLNKSLTQGEIKSRLVQEKFNYENNDRDGYQTRLEEINYFIVESSVFARKMLDYVSEGSHKYIDAEVKKGMVIGSVNSINSNQKIDVAVSYLEWYGNITDSIVNNEVSLNSLTLDFNELDKFKLKVSDIEFSINMDRISQDIKRESNQLMAMMRENAKSFIDQSMIAISDKINNNAMIAEKSISEFKGLVIELDNIRGKQKDLFEDLELINDHCEQRKKNIDSVFVAANRQGMANSFSVMAEGLKTPMCIWGSVFVCSLLLIAYAGFHIQSEFSKIKTFDEFGVAFLLKAVIVSPLVWLAWFSGRQFGHTSKLRQDYSYKSAVAMAYQGYKEEASQTGTDMHGRLLNNIVEHFSDNPVRLYEKNDASSPLEEFFKKASPEKWAEIIKSVRG